MNDSLFFRPCRIVAVACLMTIIAGCGGLIQKPPTQPAFYSLDNAWSGKRTATRQSVASSAAPTLIVSPPRAAAGFDSQRIIYTRDAYKLDYFAHSEWIDTPARMLTTAIVTAIESRNALRAVVPTPSAAAGDLRLDTEILRLQHNFTGSPSRVRFTLRAYVVDSATRRVLASREFDETVTAASEDAYGGVVAANRAVQIAMEKLANFCAEIAVTWQPPAR